MNPGLRFLALFAGLATAAHAQPPARELAYGSDALQKLDFYAAAAVRPVPLIVFVHGGGWKRGDKSNATGAAKIAHFTSEGYAFASIDYRLVPAARTEDQARDVAESIAYLVKNAVGLGIDPLRVVVMGHSAGAHLTALVATDPRYLSAAGLGVDRIKGVVLLDGAAYDVPAQMSDGSRIMQPTYAQVFGAEPERQRALSPTFQASAPNVASFLILHVGREDGTRQSEALGRALAAAGTRVRVEGLPDRGLTGHMAINRDLGLPDDPATPIVDAWLKDTLGR